MQEIAILFPLHVYNAYYLTGYVSCRHVHCNRVPRIGASQTSASFCKGAAIVYILV